MSFFPPKLFVVTNRYLLMSCKGTLMYIEMFIGIKKAEFKSEDSRPDSCNGHYVRTIIDMSISLSVQSVCVVLNHVCFLCHFFTQVGFHSSPPAQRTSIEWRRSHGGHAMPSLCLSPATPNMPSLTQPCTESPIGGAAPHSLRQAL